MSSFWTDTHCHVHIPIPGKPREQVFRRSENFAVSRWLVNGSSPGDWDSVAALAHTREGVLPQFGVHPWNSENLPSDWQSQLKARLIEFPDAGLGEIGLDLKLTDVPLDIQFPVFVRQLEIAEEMGRHCTLHIIGAWEDLHRAFDQVLPDRFLLHSFSGSAEQVPGLAEKGAWFSFGGALQKQIDSPKRIQAVQAVPDHRILLETDSPYQHPEGPDHAQEPAGLIAVAENVAKLRGVSVDTLMKQTDSNVAGFLNLPDL